jgi:hypothetical protein
MSGGSSSTDTPSRLYSAQVDKSVLLKASGSAKCAARKMRVLLDTFFRLLSRQDDASNLLNVTSARNVQPDVWEPSPTLFHVKTLISLMSQFCHQHQPDRMPAQPAGDSQWGPFTHSLIHSLGDNVRQRITFFGHSLQAYAIRGLHARKAGFKTHKNRHLLHTTPQTLPNHPYDPKNECEG